MKYVAQQRHVSEEQLLAYCFFSEIEKVTFRRIYIETRTQVSFVLFLFVMVLSGDSFQRLLERVYFFMHTRIKFLLFFCD